MRKCSICGKDLPAFPALSRKDNKTEICSRCGLMEALSDYFSHLANAGSEAPAENK